MKPQSSPQVDLFAPARHSLEALIQSLTATVGTNTMHHVVERTLSVQGTEVMRLLLQGYLELCTANDRLMVEAKAEKEQFVVRSSARAIESTFGTVTLSRCSLPATEPMRALFPLDLKLNLPTDRYSFEVRQRVAYFAVTVSLDTALAMMDRTTGAHVPKRQAQQLVVRSAADFAEFYERPIGPANDAVPHDALLVLSADCTGLSMIPSALREATRKRAEAACREAPTHGNPMAPSKKKRRAHSKRMACVTTVYDQAPTVRTAEQIVGALAPAKSTTSASPTMAKPKNKVVRASVANTQYAELSRMFDEADRRDPEQRRTTVVWIDGDLTQSRTIQRLARLRERSITVINDVIHVISYLWKAWTALCPKNEKKSWVDEQVTTSLVALLCGQLSEVARKFEQEIKANKPDAAKAKIVRKTVKYLRNHRSSMRYDEYLAAGYPIATGVVEGACRHLVKDRMDLTGAQWGLQSAEAILALRAITINGDWDAYWAFHCDQELLRTTAKLAA